jgi:hypothetical protein
MNTNPETIARVSTGGRGSRRACFGGQAARRGVALIITLGMLAVLTLLAVAFSVAMRVESMAARNYADMIRARHLVQTALSQSMTELNHACAGRSYPDFYLWRGEGNTHHDALPSFQEGPSFTERCDFLEGEALRAVPGVMLAAARAVFPYWRRATIRNGGVTQTNGLYSFLIVNISGLPDANEIGGQPRSFNASPDELNLGRLITSPNFYTMRREHKRYETPQELRAINAAITDRGRSNFVTVSYDIGRDFYFSSTNELGYGTNWLSRKFYINSIQQFGAYTNAIGNVTAYKNSPTFMQGFYNPLVTILENAGLSPVNRERPDDIAWNIVSMLDNDRVPQNSNPYPWRHVEGGENTPLISEIAFERTSTSPTQYQFKVELWYPFVPQSVTPADRFFLQIGVFNRNFAGAAPNELDIMKRRHAPWSVDHEIPNMAYGNPANEFLVFTTPTIRTNVSPSRPVWFLARVCKRDYVGSYLKTNIVDEAMGYQQSEENERNTVTAYLHRRALKEFTRPIAYAINDPRVNGQCRYWDPEAARAAGVDAAPDMGGVTWDPERPPAEGPKPPGGGFRSFGGTNLYSATWAYRNYKYQGLPIWFSNGLMRSAAELGHAYRSNMDDEDVLGLRVWRTIDLMNRIEGAALLDWITVRPTNNTERPLRGLMSVSSRQPEALRTLWHGLISGVKTADYNGTNWVRGSAVDELVNTLIANGPYPSFQRMFTDGPPGSYQDFGGPIASAMRRFARPGLTKTNDILIEAALRACSEMISFRQNMFVVLVAGRALGRTGRSVVGEQRGVATVVRDSYSGRYFIRNFKWLTD